MAIETAFVTGSTGLLGSNLTRRLAERGVRVRALARSRAKAERQLVGVRGVEVVEGDMTRVADFEDALAGADVLFHTAAHFRDSYKGGRHWERLKSINVDGTRALLEAASRNGVTRIVHTSSIAVLHGPKGAEIDETMLRRPEEADDYYRSKILADAVVFEHLQERTDCRACFVLPGWMHGPGDLGPTSAGQFTLDYLARAIPGVLPATFSFVDARDVADAMILAAEKGRRGERYLAAGRFVTARDLMAIYEAVSGVPAPTRALPFAALRVVATANEAYARLTGRPVLLGLAAFNNLKSEAGRNRFNHAKSERELGLTFRPIEETLRDEIAWFHASGRTLPARG